LAYLRESGKGIVLVSHDSDWAMALADGVLLLSRDGSLRSCSRNELLEHPEWLEDTGMLIPDWLRVANLLWRSGVSSDKIWNPAAVANAWPTAPIRSEGMLEKGEEAASSQSETVVRTEEKKSHRLKGFDPRSVWLSYVLISTGLLALADWVALGVGGLIVCLLLYAGRVSLKRWHSMILSFVIFSVLTSAIFAWGASGEGGAFEGGAFLGTLLTFTRTLFILLLGLAIPLVMSPLSLRRALEQLLTFRGKLPKRAQQLTLIVALMMRFVPVLLELWERFVRIFLSRGKSISRNPIAIGRRLRDVSIPFLLALFRLGDEVTLALESRGVGLDARPTQGTRLRWKKRDYGFVLGALALAVGLWGFANR
jgi:energy-coupling factor transport system ATP-binding protein